MEHNFNAPINWTRWYVMYAFCVFRSVKSYLQSLLKALLTKREEEGLVQNEQDTSPHVGRHIHRAHHCVNRGSATRALC